MSSRALELSGIRKRFGGVLALDDVSIEVSRGEIVAVMGDNGAGKSTLLKCIAGTYAFDAGELILDGVATHFSGPGASRAAGIEVVYQDLALAVDQPVYLNMFLGRELVRGPLRLLDKRRMRQETASILGDLKVHVPSVNARVQQLSGGQRQGIAIGRATHWATRLVLLDEPTAALGVQETARVEGTIEQLRERGLAVVIVSHSLDQVFRLADRIYVLRRGRLVGQRATAETSADEIVGLITGASRDERSTSDTAPPSKETR